MNSSVTPGDFLAAIVTLVLFFSFAHLALDSFVRSKRKELAFILMVLVIGTVIYGLSNIFIMCLHTELSKTVYILGALALTVTMLRRGQLIKI